MRTNWHKRELLPAGMIPGSVAFERLGSYSDEWHPDRFFKYNGEWYDIRDFDNVVHGKFDRYPEWDATLTLSTFSAIFIKLCKDENGENAVIVGYDHW